MIGRINDGERNPKLYLVESEVPRVASYLGLRKAMEQPESAVLFNRVPNPKISTSKLFILRFSKNTFCTVMYA